MSDDLLCPKCGSNRIVDGSYGHSWEPPAVRCQICGWRMELVMKPIKSYSKAVWESESKLRGNAAKKPCPVIGCTKEMSVKNPRDMCGECYGKLREWEVGARTRPAPLWKDEQGRWHRLRRIGREAA